MSRPVLTGSIQNTPRQRARFPEGCWRRRAWMAYQALSCTTVPDYVARITELRQLLGPAPYVVAEIGNGNLNFIYRVKGLSWGSTIVLKQAVPYLRVAGEGWPLGIARMSYEIRALQLYGKLLPNHTPRVHYADPTMGLVAMDYLGDHVTLRQAMIDGERLPLIADHLATFLATSLLMTSSLWLGSEEKRSLMGEFVANSELCRLSEDFIFTFPFLDVESNYVNPMLANERRALRMDTDFKQGILDLKYAFMTRSDALLHGDLHTGSIMVNSRETYVIDPEFSFFGPFGFDPGKLLGNFLLSYISHFHRQGGPAYRHWLLSTALKILDLFVERFTSYWEARDHSALLAPGFLSGNERVAYRERVVSQILRDTVGYAGCTLARRVLGIAGVADIRGIGDLAARTALEEVALRLSRVCVTRRSTVACVSDIETLVTAFFDQQSSSLPDFSATAR
jgi:5-methylthioribose kinase